MEDVKDMKELIFSLDIGTRNIIGIVGVYEDEVFKILAYSMRKHKKRNMYDGQIHNIEGVSNVVREIVDELEGKLKLKLTKVYLAAAGRALKTEKIFLERILENRREITKTDIESLDIEAVKKAQTNINKEDVNKEFMYYSIGYSVVDYYLDEDRIENLEGHFGSRIGVELLATFLPQVVIEGLYSVISKVGLEVSSITLEPIAAINVAIKKELRLLNLALVDIGAGTSDIAITKDGQIVYYGMTQTAGDEITESLARKYLLDFNMAEDLKLNLFKDDRHKFMDIVGIEHEKTTEEIIEDNREILEKIGHEISSEILEFNGREPAAVFLIGGSSNMPGIRDRISEGLGLPKERVSIRDLSMIENIEGLDEYTGPDMITPIGIAFEGAENKYRNFIKVNFNGEDISVFNTDKLKVSDILIISNYDPKKLIPTWPEDFVYYLDDKKRKLMYDGILEPIIRVDGLVANLKTNIKDGAIVEVVEAEKLGVDPPYLREILPEGLGAENVLVNGKVVGEDYLLEMNDRIISKKYEADLKIENPDLEEKSVRVDEGNHKILKLLVNDEVVEIEHDKPKFVFVDIFDYIDFDISKLQGRLVLEVNGREAEYLEELYTGDKLTIYWD